MAIFKVQKHFFTNSYFSISQLLIEFESGIRWNRIIVRIIITMIMTMLLIYTINNYFIIIIGMGLGSLFIVLPNFLSEKFIEYNLQNNKTDFYLEGNADCYFPPIPLTPKILGKTLFPKFQAYM